MTIGGSDENCSSPNVDPQPLLPCRVRLRLRHGVIAAAHDKEEGAEDRHSGKSSSHLSLLLSYRSPMHQTQSPSHHHRAGLLFFGWMRRLSITTGPTRANRIP